MYSTELAINGILCSKFLVFVILIIIILMTGDNHKRVESKKSMFVVYWARRPGIEDSNISACIRWDIHIDSLLYLMTPIMTGV